MVIGALAPDDADSTVDSLAARLEPLLQQLFTKGKGKGGPSSAPFRPPSGLKGGGKGAGADGSKGGGGGGAAGGGPACWHCGKTGHRRSECPTYNAWLRSQGKGRNGPPRTLNELGGDSTAAGAEDATSAEWCLSGDADEGVPSPPGVHSLSVERSVTRKGARLPQSPVTRGCSRRCCLSVIRVATSNRFAALAEEEEESCAGAAAQEPAVGLHGAGSRMPSRPAEQPSCPRGGLTRRLIDVPPVTGATEGASLSRRVNPPLRRNVCSAWREGILDPAPSGPAANS